MQDTIIIGGALPKPSIIEGITDLTTLYAAIGIAQPGDILLLEDGEYGDFVRNYIDFADYVTIRARNKHQVLFTRLQLGGTTGCSYFIFDGVRVWYDSSTEQVYSAFIVGSHIKFINCDFASSVDDNPETGAGGLKISGASDILVDNCTFHDCEIGLAMGWAANQTVRNCEFYDISRDAIEMQNGDTILIERNNFHHFITGYAHPDFIQTWTSGSPDAPRNVIVRYNVFLGDNFSNVQCMFLQANSGYFHTHRNWSIHDNMFYTGSQKGMAWETDADEIDIRNNILVSMTNQTVPNSVMISFLEDANRTVTNTVIDYCASPRWSVPAGSLTANNITMQWADRDAPYHFEAMVLDPVKPRNAQSLLPVPGSAIEIGSGYGPQGLWATIPKPPCYITATVPSADIDVYSRDFSVAAYPGGDLPESGVTYEWDFGEGGATVAGETPSHTFANLGFVPITVTARGPNGYAEQVVKTVYVESPHIVDMSLDGNIDNAGNAYNAIPVWLGTESYADGGVNLTGSNSVSIDGVGDRLSGWIQFTLSMDVKYTSGGANAWAVNFYNTFGINLLNTQHLRVIFGWYSHDCGVQASLFDGNWHNVHVTYDGRLGGTEIVGRVYLDGTQIATVSSPTIGGALEVFASNRSLRISGAYDGGSPLTGGAKNLVVLKGVVTPAGLAAKLAELRALVGAPAVTNPTVPAETITSTTAVVTSDTDQATGRMGVVCTEDNVKPISLRIFNHHDAAGFPTPYAPTQTITATGTKSFTVTGLTPSTLYYSWICHENQFELPTVIAGPSFTTDA